MRNSIKESIVGKEKKGADLLCVSGLIKPFVLLFEALCKMFSYDHFIIKIIIHHEKDDATSEA